MATIIQSDNCSELLKGIKTETPQEHDLVQQAKTNSIGDKRAATFRCEECIKDFSTRAILRRHQQIHTGVRDHKCSYCTKAFLRKSHLVRHERAHRNEKPLECQICEKRFLYSNYFKIHMKIHSGLREFQCEHCPRKFVTATLRKKHALIHIGEKPFACKVCAKRFLDKSYLTKHMVTHLEAKNFECEICFCKFADESRLHKHRRVHSIEHINGLTRTHECHNCGKKFLTSYHLKTHMRIHSGEKPFKCDDCGKAFNQKSSLNVHLKLHQGKHKCQTCGKMFELLGQLGMHMKIHKSKKYHCKTCEKIFERSKELKIHKETHGDPQVVKSEVKGHVESVSNQRYFQTSLGTTKSRARLLTCKMSNTGGKGKKAVRNHGTHSKYIETNTIPHRCSGCDTIFNHISSLRRHQKYCEKEELHSQREVVGPKQTLGIQEGKISVQDLGESEVGEDVDDPDEVIDKEMTIDIEANLIELNLNVKQEVNDIE